MFSPTQLGFRKGNRTSDALKVIHNIIDIYCHKRKGNIYGCFVDFRKAFDKVPRDILLSKLVSTGMGGKVFEIIKSMYTHDFASIKLSDGITTPIPVNQGVRQGCVLSPTLFNIYMSDLEPLLSKNNDISAVLIDDINKIPCLCWADDILLLSET